MTQEDKEYWIQRKDFAFNLGYVSGMMVGILISLLGLWILYLKFN